jgi:glutamyl-tRNA synthetase
VSFDPKAKDKFLTKDTKPILEAIRAGIAALPSLETEPLEKVFQSEAEKRGLGLGKIAQPVRVALTGGTASPGMYDVVQILGKDETLRRLDDALRLVG